MSALARITRGEMGAALPLRAVRQRPGYHWFVVGTVCIGAFMAALDASIINIALPVLKKEFGVDIHIVEWVSLIYLLTLGGLIVPFGRLADLFGRRWMYALGFAVFIAGSAMCGQLFLALQGVVQEIAAPLGAMIGAFRGSFLIVAGIAAATRILSSSRVFDPVQK